MNDNSFILNNRLFYVSVCPDHLLFQITDLQSGNLLKKFSNSVAEPVAYMNGGFCREIKANFEKKELPFKVDSKADTKKIVARFCTYTLDKKFGIGGFENADSLIELTMGISVGGGASTPYFYPWYPYIPVYNTPVPAFHGGFHLLLPSLATVENLPAEEMGGWNYYFKIYLDRNTFEPVITPQKPSINELLDYEVHRLTDQAHNELVGSIFFRNKPVLYYYVENQQQFLLKVFDAK